MTSDSSSNALLSRAPDRRPAMWPWLLMPLVTLTLYIALHSVRQSEQRTADTASPAAPAQIEAPED